MFFRPSEVNVLLGNPARAKRDFGWQPKMLFSDLVHSMVDADLKLLERNARA